MNLRAIGTGYSINLKEADARPNQEGRKFYFEPGVLADLIKGQKFNQGSIELHPKYGVSIYIGHRAEKKQDKKPAEENRHEP